MLKVFAGCCAFIICISLLLPSLLGPLPSCSPPFSPSSSFHFSSFSIHSSFPSPFPLLKSHTSHHFHNMCHTLFTCVTLSSHVSHSLPDIPDVSLFSQPQNGPNWILFNIASLYWRVVGDPASAVECLRRAVHFAPSSTRDVGYIGLANVLHKQAFLNEAVIVARSALDISGVSVSELGLGSSV